MTYTLLELHLAPVPLARKHVQAIRKGGGKAKGLRSHYSHQRFVTVPATERALIDELVRAYPNPQSGKRGTVMVARGGDYREPAWVSVQYVNAKGKMGACEQFDVLYASAHAQAVERGILRSREQVAWDKAFYEATDENNRRNRAVHLDVMVMALKGFLARTDIADEQRWCAERHLQQYKEGRAL